MLTVCCHSWRAKLEAMEAAHTAEMQAQLAKHQEAMTQLGQQLAFAADEASSLRATQGRVQGQLLALRVHMGEILEVQGAADAAAAVASSSAAAADAEVEALAADVRGALLAVLQQEGALAQEREGLLLERESLLQEREGLLLQCSALSGDLQACATNLQSMVSVVAFSVPLEAESQQGLNAKDQAVFDANLQQLHEVGPVQRMMGSGRVILSTGVGPCIAGKHHPWVTGDLSLGTRTCVVWNSCMNNALPGHQKLGACRAEQCDSTACQRS